MLVRLVREVWLGCAPRVLCGDAQRQSKDTAALAGSLVAQSLGAENSCAAGRGFFHKRRTIQKEDDLLGTALLKGTSCQALPVSRSMANNLLPDQRTHGVSRRCLWDTGSSGSPRQAQGRGRTWRGCEARQWHGCPRVLSRSSWGLLPCPVTLSPVQVVNEVPHIAGQDDPVLPHVPVIPKHAHWNVGRHFRKLPQNIVKCPSSERRERGRWVGTSFC